MAQTLYHRGPLILVLVLILMACIQAQLSTGSTIFDGLNHELAPSFVRVRENMTLRLPLDTARVNLTLNSSNQRVNGSFFFRMWFRLDPSNQGLVELPNNFRCLSNSTASGPEQILMVACSNASSNASLRLSIPSDSTPWVHLAMGGGNQSYMRVDIPSLGLAQSVGFSMPTLTFNSQSQWALLIRNHDVREVFAAMQQVNQSQIDLIMNQVISWNVNQLANYRLQKGSLTDSSKPYTLGGQLQIQDQNISEVDWAYESAPIDMCQTQLNFTQLLLINTEQNNFTLSGRDPRVTVTTNFAYTYSVWMKTLPGIRTTTNPQIARDSLSFFEMTEVFSLWFSNSQALRVFFHATKNAYEQSSTQAVYIPLGQWVNLQLVIERINGYEARVYDLARREVTRVKESLYLQDQSPTGTFTFLRNFKGYMKQVMLFNKALSFLVDISNGQFDTLRDQTLILYYKFDQIYFNQSTIPSQVTYTQNNQTQQGQPVSLSGSLQFDTVEWDTTFSFANASQYGLLNQSSSLFDGVTCFKNSSPQWRFTGSNSVLQSNQFIKEQVSEITVEFWFRRLTPMKQDNYLVQFFSNETLSEVMSISQINQSLLCSMPNQASISIESYSTNQTQWSFLACRVKSGNDLTGMIFQERFKYYGRNLTANFAMSPGAYTLYVGNSQAHKDGQVSGSYFKELRLWLRARTFDELSAGLFHQIDPTSKGLVAYFKMTTGDSTVTNFAMLNYPTNQAAIMQGLHYDTESIAASTNLCPVGTFRKGDDMSCYKNPFLSHELQVLPFPDAEGMVQIRYTSYYSEMVSSLSRFQVFKTNAFKFVSQLENMTSNSSGSIIPPNVSLQINQQVHSIAASWQSSASLNVKVNQCSYFMPVNSTSSEQELYLAEPPGTRDVVVSFSAFNTCVASDLAFNQSRSTFKVLGGKIGVSWAYERLQGRYDVTLASQDLAKVPYYEPIIVLGRLQFGADEEDTFQNIVYNIKFIEAFSPVITGQKIVLKGETMRIEGVFSKVAQSLYGQEDSGLAYSWGCPLLFQSLCSGNENYLEFAYDSFRKLGGQFDTLYMFSLQVYRGSDPDVNLDLLPITSFTLQFVDTLRPDYEIFTPSQILASESFSLSIALKNYDLIDSNLQIGWKISPEAFINPDYVGRSKYGETLVVNKGALTYNTNYTVSVTVSNRKYEEAVQVKELSFQTYPEPPVNGTVSIESQDAFSMQSEFKITAVNWVTTNVSESIEYTASVMLPGGIVIPLQSLNSILPYGALELQVKIFSSNSPEYTLYQYPLSLQLPQSPDTAAARIEPYLQYDNIQLLPQKDLLMTLNNFTLAVSHIVESRQWNQGIIMRVLTAIAMVEDTTLTDIEVQAKVITILSIISQSDNAQYDAYLQVKNLTQKIAQISAPIPMENKGSFSGMVGILSNMAQFLVNRQAQNSTQTRLLSSDIIDPKKELRELFQIKDSLVQRFCSHSTGLENIQFTFTSSLFELTVMQADELSLVKQRSFFDSRNFSTYLSYPMEQVQQSKLCLSVTLIKNSSVYSRFFQVKNQTMSLQAPVIQFQQFQLDPSNASESLSLGIQFSYDYNQSKALSKLDNFRHNQTVIEALSEPLTDEQWSYCATQYLVDYQLMGAKCMAQTVNGSLSIMVAVITDTNRILIIDYNTPWYSYFLEGAMNFDEAVLPVLIFLIAFNVGVPFLATLLDKSSYTSITEGQETDVNKDFIRQVASKKSVPYEFMLYYRTQLQTFYDLRSVSWGSLFCLYLKYLLPLGSLFFRFDIEYKRLARFMILSFQVSFIAIVTSIVFSLQGYSHLRDEDSDSKGERDQSGMDNVDLINAVIVGIVLSMLTLPPWQTLLTCFKSRLIVERTEQAELNSPPLQDKPQLEGGSSEDANFESRNNKSDNDVNLTQDAGFNDSHFEESRRLKGNNHSRNSSGVPQPRLFEEEVRADRDMGMLVSQNNQVICKLFLMLLCMLSTLAALMVVGFVSSEAPKGNSEALSLSFFISVIFGHFVLNLLRIILNAHFAPKIAQALEEDNPSVTDHFTNFLLVSPDALTMLDIMLIVYEVKQSLKVSAEQHPMAQSLPSQINDGPGLSEKRYGNNQSPEDEHYTVKSKKPRQQLNNQLEHHNFTNDAQSNREVTDFNSRSEEKLSPEKRPYNLDEMRHVDNIDDSYQRGEQDHIDPFQKKPKTHVPPLLFSALPPQKIEESGHYLDVDITDRYRVPSQVSANHSRAKDGNTTRIYDTNLDNHQMVSKRAFKEDESAFDLSARDLDTGEAKKTSRRKARRDRYQANALQGSAPKAKHNSEDDMEDIGLTPRREDPVQVIDVQQIDFEMRPLESSNKSLAVILQSNSSQNNQSQNQYKVSGSHQEGPNKRDSEASDNYQDFM